MYIIVDTYIMKPKMSASSHEPFARQVLSLWPALKGSLAKVCKPCIRPQCRACACGDHHPAYLLSFTHQGRRRCMYVPAALVPLIRRAVNNGRRIEELLYRVGPALIREHRQIRTALKTPKGRVTSTHSDAFKKKSVQKS